MGKGVPHEDRNAMLALAQSGNTAAIEFLQETPTFMDKGGRVLMCYKILMAAGNERARQKYDWILQREQRWRDKKRAQREAEQEFVARAWTPSNQHEDDMDTEDHARDAEIDASVDDVAQYQDVVESQRREPMKIKLEKLASSTKKSRTAENLVRQIQSPNIDASRDDGGSDHLVPVSGAQATLMPGQMESTALSDEEMSTTSATLYDPSSPPYTDFGTEQPAADNLQERDEVAGDAFQDGLFVHLCTLRKRLAEAGSHREARTLNRLRLETSLRSPSSHTASQFDPAYLKERSRLQMELALAEADISFHQMMFEAVEMALKNLGGGLDVEETFEEESRVKIRKAWFDAEYVFADLVLAFPECRDIERPAFPQI